VKERRNSESPKRPAIFDRNASKGVLMRFLLNGIGFSSFICIIIVFAPIYATDRISEDLRDIHGHVLLAFALADFFLIIAILDFPSTRTRSPFLRVAACSARPP